MRKPKELGRARFFARIVRAQALDHRAAAKLRRVRVRAAREDRKAGLKASAGACYASI
jgi:hypothetical protein